MVSAALLMLTGVEQSGKSAGSADLSVDLSVDQGEPEGISFAKSFRDRVGESGSLQAKSATKEAQIGLLPDSKAAVLTKKLDAVVAMPGEGKGVARAAQEAAAPGKVKNAASLPGAAPEAAGLGLGAKAAGNDTAAKNVVPGASVGEGETTDDALSSSSTSSTVPVALQPNDHVVLPESSIEQGRPVVSSAGSAFVPKELSDGKMKEILFVGKKAKIPEKTPESKAVQATFAGGGNVISKPAEAALKEDSGTASTQGIVTGVVAPPKEGVRPTGDPINRALPGVAVASLGVPAAGSVIHKQTEHEAKAGAVDSETAMTFADGQPVSEKFGGELEKAPAAVAPATGSGSDSKMQSASGPGMLMAHPAAGGLASGGAALNVVSGSATGEPVSTKPQIGQADVHTAGLTVGSGVQARLGVVVEPNDAIPTMLKATPATLEVGIQDGTHGWLKVRAEMADGGVVNASVSAASSTGQEMLRRELPAITAYLEQEKVVVNTIAVHTPLAAGAEQRSSTGMDGAGGQTRQGGHEGNEPQQNIRKGLPAGPDERLTYQSLQGVDEDGSLSLAAYRSGGSWLSVRA